MTAPLSWTASAPTAAPPLVVRPDRGKARRWMAFAVGANAFIAVISAVGAIWAAGATGEWWAGAAMTITLAGSVFQMVFHAFAYGRFLGAETIAEIGPQGIRGPTTRWERVELPWSSIAAVANGWNAVVVKPVPGAGPKLVIPTRATDSTAATIRAAIHHFSGGRL